VHYAQQLSSFWAPDDVVRYTTEELLVIAGQYTIIEEVIDPHPVP
jgi:hypothetical protein